MSNGEKFRILIVDDEKSNITTLSHILKPTYTVFIATDGQTGIQVARENIPDLILLDIVMPGMSGFEVLASLKNSDTTRGIPVIFITGRDSAEDEELGFFLGAVDYITKPFHKSIVKARVRTHLLIVKQIRTIERLCMIDALTDIPNRRAFNERLKTEWKRCTREKTPLSLLMIDMDKFKDYNDTYGHSQGDTALQSLAEILKQTVKRPTDFVARWGGEEFAALLSDTDLAGALEVAEQIRAKAECAVIPSSQGTDTKISVSIGVTSQMPSPDSMIEDFTHKADKALYAAKEAGRNTVLSL